MPCGQECSVKLREVKDLDLHNIQVFLGQQRRFDYQATDPAPAALRAVVHRYTQPQPSPGTQPCPNNCPCELFHTSWSNWKTVPISATYNVPGLGQLVARTTAKRRVGKGTGWCEEPEIALSDQFFTPAGADVALMLKPGVHISDHDAKHFDSLFMFHVASAPVAAEEISTSAEHALDTSSKEIG